jgi:predicted helicase
MLDERVYLTPELFPTEETENKNLVICCTSHSQMPFSCLVTNCLPNEAVGGRNGQCFGLYGFSSDGGIRADHITDWGLDRFRSHYGESKITKEQIFQYVYAVLHHPLYRELFGQNLRAGIPRIPYEEDFGKYVEVGGKLIKLHVDYEAAEPFELKWAEHPRRALSYMVSGQMRLDTGLGTVTVNDSLTLEGIPQDAFLYRLGTRSAIEWVVDQYKFEQDEDGNVSSDPNDPGNDRYIVDLIGRVTTVSINTVNLIKHLPAKMSSNTPTIEQRFRIE